MSLASENQEETQLNHPPSTTQEANTVSPAAADVLSSSTVKLEVQESSTPLTASSVDTNTPGIVGMTSDNTNEITLGSILDQLTSSAEKGSISSVVNGSSVIPNVFSASGGQVGRQDPASSSLPCNNLPPTTINTEAPTTLQLIWDKDASTTVPTATTEEHQKKKKPGKKGEIVQLAEGERDSIVSSLKVKRIQAKAVCSNCGCMDTPTWRKGPLGTGTLCNACGIKYSTNVGFLDPGTGAQQGVRPFIKYNDAGHLVSESLKATDESKPSSSSSSTTGSEESATSSQLTNTQTSLEAAATTTSTNVSTPEKQGKRSRGRPKGSSNKKKPAPPLEATVQTIVASASSSVELPPPSPPQVEKKRGRGRPRTKPLPSAPQSSTDDADQMMDEESELTIVGTGKGKRKRKADDDEYVPEEEKPVVIQSKPKHRKIVTLPVGSDTQVLSLQNIQKTFSNNSDNCIYISSDYLMQCIEGFKLTIKQGSKKNNGELNRRITTDSLVYIFLFLDIPDLLTCFSVCRHWYESAKSDVIWKEIYRHNWSIDEKSLAEYTTGILAPPPSINWFDLVQARINIRIYSPIQQIHLMSQFYAIENKSKILACIQENLNEEITVRKNSTTPKL